MLLRLAIFSAGKTLTSPLFVILTLVIVLTMLSGIPDHEDGPDFYTLLLGSTIGMMLMASANHLLMLFVGIEMTSDSLTKPVDESESTRVIEK